MLVTGSRNGESIERLKKMIHGTSEEDDDEQGVQSEHYSSTSSDVSDAKT